MTVRWGCPLHCGRWHWGLTHGWRGGWALWLGPLAILRTA